MSLNFLKLNLFVSIVAVFVGAIQSPAVAATDKPAKQPPAKPSKPQGPIIVPRIYSSVSALLARVPGKLTRGASKELSSEQADAVNQWLKANVPRGSMLTLAGKMAGYSGTQDNGVTINFQQTSVVVGGVRLKLRPSATLPGDLLAAVSKIGGGKNTKTYRVRTTIRTGHRMPSAAVTVHGRIASIYVVGGLVNLRLSGGGLGSIRSSRYRVAKPKPTSRPKPKPQATTRPATQPKKPTVSDLEAKASRKFKLAKSYHGYGKKDKAIAILKSIVADYPGTPSAKAASAKLKELD